MRTATQIDGKMRICSTRLSGIQRQLDIELEKLRKSNDIDFFENTPDVRTIARIVHEINDLDPEVALAKLPRHVWILRSDYDALKQIEEISAEMTVKPGLELSSALQISNQEVRSHDQAIFKNSDKVLNESGFDKVFDFLSRNCCLKSQLLRMLRFPQLFVSENGKYSDWKLNYLCSKLCQMLMELSFIIETDSVEMSRMQGNQLAYKQQCVQNEYSRLLRRLLKMLPKSMCATSKRTSNIL